MKKNRFTLIELLVVIAIISVLSTLLFPVVGAVQGRGRTAVCLSNIRQVAMLHLMYTDDNGGYFCPAWDDNFNQWDTSGDYRDGGILAKSVRTADANKTEIFSCPEASAQFFKDNPWQPRFAGYGYNYLLSFASHKDYPPNYRLVRKGRIRRPSSVILAADAVCFYDAKTLGITSFLNAPSSGIGGYADFRHDERAVASYVDGHAAAVSTIHPAVSGEFEGRVGYIGSDDSAYDPYYRK